MTDKEIIQALECCAKDDCENCPLSNYDGCKSLLFDGNIVLDLINRQKAEIEKAWELFKKQSDENIEMQKLCDKQKAEIEELQHKIMSCNSEAIKEFAKADLKGLSECLKRNGR